MSKFRNKIYDIYADLVFNLNKKSSKKIIKDKSTLPEGFTVTYHSGALNTKPNTVKSIDTAISHGAKIVEIDVSFRPDGTPVIIHNSAPEINQGVLLENALKAVAQSKTCMINLDIKSTANLGAVDELVMQYGLTERVFYTGVFDDWVEKVKSSSSIPYYLNHSITNQEATDISFAQAVADKAKKLGAIGINSNYNPATELFVETMRKNGLLVSLWTVNNMQDMVKVIRLKPDNITTKKPHYLKRILAEYREYNFNE